MGTFGLCDYLNRKDIEAKILNLAVYRKEDLYKIISKYIETFKPTHVGLIFHWQETAEGVLLTGEYIKSRFKGIKLICGGFTAGYFGKDLLEKCRFFDFIIKGDPEKPLELLLKGAEPAQIPNLIHRKGNSIASNEVSYRIDNETLSSLSFCTLPYLYDYKLYIKAVEQKLGFPLFIGRGCVYNCSYCGGSRGSFITHSGKYQPVVRSINSVISDLKNLKEYTKKIYICYETDRNYIKALFKAIKKEKVLIKKLQLNYGAWKLLDREFLELYKEIFILDENSKPIFELSPEVFDYHSRKKIKDRHVFYTMEELKENVRLIDNCLNGNVNISLFFSRYHDAVKTYADMKEEIRGVFLLKHGLFSSHLKADVFYDHLSTDAGSRYWERYVKNPYDFDTLISSERILKAQEQYSFPVNNLSVYKPETISEIGRAHV
jgi:hypothetical protein